ncbi:MAG TPA: hypothetical protein VF266_03090 [Thermoanaerobaculia bacterium]
MPTIVALFVLAQPVLRPFEAEGFAALNAGDHARCFAGLGR